MRICKYHALTYIHICPNSICFTFVIADWIVSSDHVNLRIFFIRRNANPQFYRVIPNDLSIMVEFSFWPVLSLKLFSKYNKFIP